jgi:hypothetical protein
MHFVEEPQARALIEAGIEPKDAESGAVVQGGVLEDLLASQLDDLDVDLHGIT